jgi:hypothetical protein
LKVLICLFVYTFFLTITLPLLFNFHLLYFAPFLVICFYRTTLINSLWWAFSCGFMIDLLASETRLGFYALNYCLATIWIYRYQFHFFEDRFSTLPIMTFLISFAIALIQGALYFLIDKPFYLSLDWVQRHLLSVPLQIAFYSIIAFKFPSLLIAHLKKRASIYKRRHS